jgi:hypothetical protein
MKQRKKRNPKTKNICFQENILHHTAEYTTEDRVELSTKSRRLLVIDID